MGPVSPAKPYLHLGGSKRVAQKAIVLLSGGLDSAVAAAVARSKGFGLHALTIDYGQKHSRELIAARSIAERLGALEHKVLRVDIGQFGTSALTDSRIEVPASRKPKEIGRDIPVTYVPARNTVLLSLGLSWAEAIDADAVFIGAHSLDYSGYPDCRPEFIEAFQRVSALGTKRGIDGRAVAIEAPLLRKGKAEIIRLGMDLGVPFELTWSCYAGTEKACGVCDSCSIRLMAFKEVGIDDPIEYAR